MAKYEKRQSKVSITFTDGEVKDYIMTASHSIASYLMREAAQTGVLVIRNDDEKSSNCIPISQIRDVEVVTLPPVEVVEYSAEGESEE